MTRNFPLWIEPSEGRLYNDWLSTNTAEPLVFKQGDSISFDLHLIKKNSFGGQVMEEVPFPDGCTVRFAIGLINQKPTAGTFTLGYGGQTVSVNYDSTATQVQTALNTLTTIISAGGVSVLAVGTSMFQVSFTTAGVKGDITTDASTLFPTSTAKVVVLKEGTLTVKKIVLLKLSQSPVVYQSSWSDMASPQISVTTLVTNQQKRVTIYPSAKTGTWLVTTTQNVAGSLEKLKLTVAPTQTQINTAYGVNRTRVVSADAVVGDFFVGPQKVDWFLQDGTVDDTGKPHFQADVFKSDEHSWDFNIRSDFTPTTPYTFPLTVDGGGLIGWRAKTGLVSFNTAELESLIGGASSVNAILEIEVQDAIGNRQTVLQTNCSITNDLIDQSTFTTLAFDEPVGEAPINGEQYVRKDGGWQILNVDGGTY